MFNKNKTILPQVPPPPAKPEESKNIIRSTVPEQDPGEFDQVMFNLDQLDKKVEILVSNQSKIFDEIRDQCLLIRDQNSRIRELIISNNLDLPKFEKSKNE